ncbi:MAG: GNAT family N-acetyltransferase [Pseudomonadota bacterium]
MNQILTLRTDRQNPISSFDGDILGQLGKLQVRLARSENEVANAQRIRFSVFHNEFGAKLDDTSMQLERDQDVFDAYCDHLIVLDTELPGAESEQIVGTYRLMRKQNAAKAGGYYSADEFTVASLIARHSKRNFLELGRSCVLPAYRSKRTIELLWQGIWAYARTNNIDVMIGCASFAGTVPARHAEALTFLNTHAKARGEWHIAPLPGRHVDMDMMPEEAINLKSAINKLPPLIKGYLRLGAAFGDGAVVDPIFKTVDVMVVLPVEHIKQRYKSYYGERYAA